MTRRAGRRPRTQCPLRPLAIECHAYGHEAACSLCELVDLAAPVTQATLGNLGPQDAPGDPEQAFWDHLARRHDGGPTTRAALIESWDPATSSGRDRPWRAEHQFWEPKCDLPIDAPF